MRETRRIGRLTKRSEFVAAASGRRFHTERMTVQGLLRPDGAQASEPCLRIGFTVTKRAGRATERNRMRRRLRAAALEALPADTELAADVVVIARRPVLGADYRALVADLKRAVAAVTKRQPTSRPPSP